MRYESKPSLTRRKLVCGLIAGSVDDRFLIYALANGTWILQDGGEPTRLSPRLATAGHWLGNDHFVVFFRDSQDESVLDFFKVLPGRPPVSEKTFRFPYPASCSTVESLCVSVLSNESITLIDPRDWSVQSTKLKLNDDVLPAAGHAWSPAGMLTIVCRTSLARANTSGPAAPFSIEMGRLKERFHSINHLGLDAVATSISWVGGWLLYVKNRSLSWGKASEGVGSLLLPSVGSDIIPVSPNRVAVRAAEEEKPDRPQFEIERRAAELQKGLLSCDYWIVPGETGGTDNS